MKLEDKNIGPLDRYHWTWALVLVSSGTLVCCALPILLVTMGLGAAVAAATSAVPGLVILSQYKGWVFAAAAMLLLASAWLIFGRTQACPADTALAKKCATARRWNVRLLWIGIGMWAIGGATAYVYPLFL